MKSSYCIQKQLLIFIRNNGQYWVGYSTITFLNLEIIDAPTYRPTALYV